MKTKSEIRTEIINLIREWDMQDDTIEKLSHRDLTIKIEDIYLNYAQQVAEDVRQRCYENAVCFIAWEDEEPKVSEGSILNTEIILP